jgi:hypothetical protein
MRCRGSWSSSGERGLGWNCFPGGWMETKNYDGQSRNPIPPQLSVSDWIGRGNAQLTAVSTKSENSSSDRFGTRRPVRTKRSPIASPILPYVSLRIQCGGTVAGHTSASQCTGPWSWSHKCIAVHAPMELDTQVHRSAQGHGIGHTSASQCTGTWNGIFKHY